MIQVTRRYRFSASHRLHTDELSQERNRELYGKCNHPYGHGHNYEVEISVRGPLDARSGHAVDVAALDRLVEREVLRAFDHRNLNVEIEELRGLVPTSENLAIELHRRLQRHWPETFPGAWPRLRKIRIAETARNIFEVEES